MQFYFIAALCAGYAAAELTYGFSGQGEFCQCSGLSDPPSYEEVKACAAALDPTCIYKISVTHGSMPDAEFVRHRCDGPSVDYFYQVHPSWSVPPELILDLFSNFNITDYDMASSPDVKLKISALGDDCGYSAATYLTFLDCISPPSPTYAPTMPGVSTVTGAPTMPDTTVAVPNVSSAPTMPDKTTTGLDVSSAPTVPETSPPTVPETSPPTVPETSPPTVPETSPSTMPGTSPPTVPVSTTTGLDVSSAPTVPETSPPTVPKTSPPTAPETSPPTSPPTVSVTTSSKQIIPPPKNFMGGRALLERSVLEQMDDATPVADGYEVNLSQLTLPVEWIGLTKKQAQCTSTLGVGMGSFTSLTYNFYVNSDASHFPEAPSGSTSAETALVASLLSTVAYVLLQ